MNDIKKEGAQPREFGPAQQQELRTLRKKQIEGEFTDRDRTHLLELTALEKASNKPLALSLEEHAEYLRLTREQIASGENWTEEKIRRVAELQKRLEGRH
ncbi:MAG: hypothetical protein AAB792_01710 [Patescibacteria group bacterium]